MWFRTIAPIAYVIIFSMFWHSDRGIPKVNHAMRKDPRVDSYLPLWITIPFKLTLGT
jgi:hypothetical protein